MFFLPRDRFLTWAREDAGADLLASLLTFLATLPLSVGIAIACGARIEAGLLAAAVGGIVAGALGGVPLHVTGPAAGLTAVTAQLVLDVGWRAACAATVAAGLLQVLLGAARGARLLMVISPATVRGMLAGIGTTILLGQTVALLGREPAPAGPENLRALPGALEAARLDVAMTGAATVLAVWLWSRLPRPVSVVPATLAAAVILTVGTWWMDLPRIGSAGNLLDALGTPELPQDHLLRLAGAAVTIAVVSGIETLCSAQTLMGHTPGKRADLDRELCAQGTANLISGAVGALPVAGLVLRGAGHVQAGARTRSATVVHGVWILIFSTAMIGVLGHIPLAVTAGLLIVVGVRLIGISQGGDVIGRPETVVFVVAACSVLCFGVGTGLLCGLTVSLLLALRQGVRAQVLASAPSEDPHGPWTVSLQGTVTFLALPRLSRELDRIPPGTSVHLELIADFLDRAVHDELSSWIACRRAEGSTVTIDEVGPPLLSRYRAGDPPSGRDDRPHPPRWLVPWSVWQTQVTVPPTATDPTGSDPAGNDPAGNDPANTIRADATSAGTDLLGGMAEFHRRTSPLLSEVFASLAEGQRPTTLFITCVDSRVVPNLITSSGPGDLFTVRTMGNLVPPAGLLPGDSTVAAVEYAVEVLGVSSVVVCGHSACGAMHAVAGPPTNDLPAVEAWLSQARAQQWPIDPTLCSIDDVSRANVVCQLEHLRSHRVVARAEADGRIGLVGMFFDIAAGRSLILEQRTGEFLPVR